MLNRDIYIWNFRYIYRIFNYVTKHIYVYDCSGISIILNHTRTWLSKTINKKLPKNKAYIIELMLELLINHTKKKISKINILFWQMQVTVYILYIWTHWKIVVKLRRDSCKFWKDKCKFWRDKEHVLSDSMFSWPWSNYNSCYITKCVQY